MKNRKNRFLAFGMGCVLGFSCVFSSYATNADLKDAKNKMSSLQEEKKKVQDTLKQLEGLKSDAAAYVKELDKKLTSLDAELSQLEKDISAKESQIKDTKAELEALRAVCDRCGLYLFLDGARLGYGLAAEDNDLDLESIAANCDVFYIGGTKMGALFGEAVVICNLKLQEDFRYLIKQKGGMLAKGRLLGIQFLELLQDGLYFDLGEHAVKLAQKLREGLLNAGYKMQDSTTNQQFVIVSDEELKKIEEKYCVSYIERIGEDQNVIRICTSWATMEENVEQFLRDAEQIKKAL